MEGGKGERQTDRQRGGQYSGLCASSLGVLELMFCFRSETKLKAGDS